MPNLAFIVSTLNEGIFKAASINFPKHNEVIIVHQIADASLNEYYQNTYQNLFESSYQVIQSNLLGLSKSRNLGISNCTSSWMMLCDDDVVLAPFCESIIKDAIQNFETSTIFTFSIGTQHGKQFKNYPQKSYFHNWLSIAKVSSIEMVINRAWWQRNKILFDEQFGLGARYCSGEEFIALSDALKAKSKIAFIPRVVVYHDSISSGRIYTKQLIISKGAMFIKVYPHLYVLFNVAFALKKYPEYYKYFGFIQFCKLLFSGSSSYASIK